jgi:hypothetical protein
MLVFGRENMRVHRPWLLAAVAVAAVAAFWYIVYGYWSGSWNWPSGASPPGFVLGVIGGLVILFEMLLWPRKSQFRGWRLGRAKVWMTAHIWLGLLTLPLLLMHGGFHFNLLSSTLAAALMWLLVLVVGSGLLGLAFQNILPRLILDQVPSETIYAQIGHVLEQYRAEAGRLVEITCGRAPADGEGENGQDMVGVGATAQPSYTAVGSARQVGRIQGKMFNTEIEAKFVPGSDALFAFYRDQIEPYLRARSGRRLPLGKPAQALAMFEAMKIRLPLDARPVVNALAELCHQRRQFDLQARLHFWLHSWLGVHVALSLALTLLMFVHVILALKYI